MHKSKIECIYINTVYIFLLLKTKITQSINKVLSFSPHKITFKRSIKAVEERNKAQREKSTGVQQLQNDCEREK